MKRRWRRITPEKRRQIIRLAARGATYQQIADTVDLSFGAVGIVLRPLGGVTRKEMWDPGTKRLSLDERVEIRLGLEGGPRAQSHSSPHRSSPPQRSAERSTPNGGRHNYRPLMAHQRAQDRARRPKRTKLAATPRLCARVVADLQHLWSPEQIAARLRDEFGDDHSMRISHETIYKTLYVQGRGKAAA